MSEEQIRRWIAPDNRHRHGYVERDGVLVLSEQRVTGWRPGGQHGAECYGGPLDAVTVLVDERESWIGSLSLEGREHEGRYEMTYSEMKRGEVVGAHRIGVLAWIPAPPSAPTTEEG